ncbi:hypothetical protein AeMF1_014147 [Aphanomyces euteiches]|nr:hypothetical protein AeMF1_014147 [Aphanomyces euteiches]
MEGLLAVVILVLLAVAGYLYTRQSPPPPVPARKEEVVAKPHEAKKPAKKAKHPEITSHPKAKPLPEHALLAHVLKGHTGAVTGACFSSNGRFIATTSTDRTVRLTLRESLGSKNPVFRTINIPYDYATTCSFSSDGKTLAIVTADGQTVQLFSKFKAKPEMTHSVHIGHDVQSLLLNDIGDDWMTILSVGKDQDTNVKCWNTLGDLLQTTSINQIENFHGVQSRDNRFIAIAAFTPEVKIYEIKRTKDGKFDKFTKVMALQGHKSGVLDVAFDGSDTTPLNHIVTSSKDGTVRLWDINVRYKLEEDPKCIRTFTSDQVYSAVDITANGKVIALAHGTAVTFLKTENMQVVAEIPNAQEDAITRVEFDALGEELLVQGSGSRIVKVYHTPKSI